MRWLVLVSSLTSKNGYGVLCRSATQAMLDFGEVELDIYSGERRKHWWPGRKNLKSEMIAEYPKLWFFIAIFDWLLLKFRTRGHYDGVLVLVEHYAAAGWFFSRSNNIPCILVQCGTYAVKLPYQIPFFRKILLYTDRIVPISNYTKSRMEAEEIKGRYTVVPLGVDLKDFYPSENKRKNNEVLFVGNLKSRKGIDFLLDGVALANKTIPNTRLRVVGNIDQASAQFFEVSKKISSLGLDVEFLGSLSSQELREAYSQSKINVLPSKSDRFFFEGFGLIHLEANACGTLTIGTLESGNEDAIQEGFGKLVSYGDIEALSEAIVAALTVNPYPIIPTNQLRTWNDVAKDYLRIMRESIQADSK